MCVISAAAAATIGAVATAVSTGISIAGAVQQGNAAEEQAEYEAEIAAYEAEIARQAGEVEMVKHGISQRKAFGRQMAQMAASNVDLSFGSAANELVETRKFQAFDSEILGRSIDNRVLGIHLQGDMARARGKNAKAASVWGAVGAGIGGVAQLGSQALAYNSVGVGGGTKLNTDLKYGGDNFNPSLMIG